MKRALLLFASITVLVMSCQKNEVTISNAEYKPHELVRTKSDADMTKAVNTLAFDLLKEGYGFNNNELYSPASLSMALSMAADGAYGETFDEIRSVLGYSQMTVDDIDAYNNYLLKYLPSADKTVDFSMANSVWVSDGFQIKNPYTDQASTFYDAEVANLDFSSDDTKDRINEWCNLKTQGMIPELFARNPDALLLLINVLYFNAGWNIPFTNSMAGLEFEGESGEKAKLQSFATRWEVPYYENESFQMIRIPVGEGAFSLTVLLPSKGKSLAEALISSSLIWPEAIKKLAVAEVEIQMPQFSIDTSVDLKSALKNLGMDKAFTGAAEFPFIADSSICISDVLQKSKIDVSAEGIKAAAVTEIDFKYTSSGPNDGLEETHKFIADHPFIFTLEENETGVILFAGVKSSIN